MPDQDLKVLRLNDIRQRANSKQGPLAVYASEIGDVPLVKFETGYQVPDHLGSYNLADDRVVCHCATNANRETAQGMAATQTFPHMYSDTARNVM